MASRMLEVFQKHKDSMLEIYLRNFYFFAHSQKYTMSAIRKNNQLTTFKIEGPLGVAHPDTDEGLPFCTFDIGRNNKGRWYGRGKELQQGLMTAMDAYVTKQSEDYPGEMLRSTFRRDENSWDGCLSPFESDLDD